MMTDRKEYMKEYMRRFRAENPDRDQAYREAGAVKLLRKNGYTILKDGALIVVRCKNCKYRGFDNCPMEFYWENHQADDNAFCSFGVKKGDAG